jgi:hypothetical protein
MDVLEHTYTLPKGWYLISTHLNYNYNLNKQLTTTDWSGARKRGTVITGQLFITVEIIR